MYNEAPIVPGTYTNSVYGFADTVDIQPTPREFHPRTAVEFATLMRRQSTPSLVLFVPCIDDPHGRWVLQKLRAVHKNVQKLIVVDLATIRTFAISCLTLAKIFQGRVIRVYDSTSDYDFTNDAMMRAFISPFSR